MPREERDSAQQQVESLTITAPTEREIHFERVSGVPWDRVFAAYTDPELIPARWGPRGTITGVDQTDLRPGGSWRFVLHKVGWQ